MIDPADTVLAEAARLRHLGLSPIPIKNWSGHCPRSYAHYREGGMPSSVFEQIVVDQKAHGIQCLTSAAWRNVIIDLDGYEGVRRWESWCRKLGCPPTWRSISPSGGVHLWFDVPHDVDYLPSLHLWRGEGHAGVEILGDGKQGRCWPSYRIVRGKRVPYVWDAGYRPWEIPKGVLPRWAVDLAQALRPRVETGATFPLKMSRGVATPPQPARGHRVLPEWTDIRDGIAPDVKLDLAVAWGLRVRSRTPNPAGWVSCHSIFREDRTPSASFNVRTGGYWEEGLKTQNFFWLALQLNAYTTFWDCLEGLAPIAGIDRRIA